MMIIQSVRLALLTKGGGVYAGWSTVAVYCDDGGCVLGQGTAAQFTLPTHACALMFWLFVCCSSASWSTRYWFCDSWICAAICAFACESAQEGSARAWRS